MGALQLGRGQDDGVDVGPLIDDKAVESVTALVEQAVGAGARVVTGGSAPDGPGFFFSPTVLADVPVDADVNTRRSSVRSPRSPPSRPRRRRWSGPTRRSTG